MTNTSKRIVARSTEACDRVSAYRYLKVPAVLLAARAEIAQRVGLSLPAIEPEFHIFAAGAGTVSTVLTGGPTYPDTEVLRCVVEVDNDGVTAHGTTARPVISVRISDSKSGWHSHEDDTYDAVVFVGADHVRALLIDLFLDFTISSAEHLRYIFDGYVSKYGFTEFGKRKAEFIRKIGLRETRYGQLDDDVQYANFASSVHIAAGTDLARLVELWEMFALESAFREFAGAEAAAISLGKRKKIGGQLSIGGLREAINASPSGVLALAVFTPQVRTSRDLKSEAARAFLMKAPSRNSFSVMEALDLWTGDYSKARKRLVREEFIRIERFILQN